jgi:ABC-type iron transport system FetAB permease component
MRLHHTHQAVKPLVVNCMRTGLTPTLNNMRVLGLVSIPGMMVRLYTQ